MAPNYFNKYQLLTTANERIDERGLFFKFLESLTVDDFEQLLTDIFLEDVYPTYIQRYRKETDVLNYFAGFFLSVSSNTMALISEALYKLARRAVSDKKGPGRQILEQSVKLTGLLEKGLSADVLINFIILNTAQPKNLRQEAAIALSILRLDHGAINFWRNNKSYQERENSFLVVPRFNFFQKTDLIDAYSSFLYADESAVNIPGLSNIIEDTFFLLVDDESIWDNFLTIYKKLPSFIVQFIEPILRKPNFSSLLQYIDENRNVYELGDPIDNVYFKRFFKKNLKKVVTPTIDDMKPFDQDYFIDYAEELGLFESNGYKLERKKFTDYPSSFAILNEDPLAIVLKPLRFLEDPSVSKYLRGPVKYSPAAIINFFKGPSIAGSRQLGLSDKSSVEIEDYFTSLLYHLRDKKIYTLDYGSQSFYEHFVYKELADFFRFQLKSPPEIICHPNNYSEDRLYEILTNGDFILTTGPLYALAKSSHNDIFLTPDDVSSMILRASKTPAAKESMLQEQYGYGIHNVMIVNRSGESSNEDVNKLASIAYLTADHISKDSLRFANFIERKWHEHPKKFDSTLDIASISESLAMSYYFSPIDKYGSVYFDESSYMLFHPKSNDNASKLYSIYKKISSEREYYRKMKADWVRLMKRKEGKLDASKKAKIKVLDDDFEFCLKNGLTKECETIGRQIQKLLVSA